MAENTPVNIEEALQGAPDWALKFGLWLSNKVDLLQKEVSTIHAATVYSSETVEKVEKVALENKAEIDLLKAKCELLQVENNKLSDRIINIEAQSRRENLLIYGVKENMNETEQELRLWLKDFLINTLGFSDTDNMKVERIHHKGPKMARYDRPVIVKWHSFKTRQAVWEQRKNLKNTTLFLAEDFPKEI